MGASAGIFPPFDFQDFASLSKSFCAVFFLWLLNRSEHAGVEALSTEFAYGAREIRVSSRRLDGAKKNKVYVANDEHF